MPRGQQPVVDRLSRHTALLSRWLSGSHVYDEIAYPPSAIFARRAISSLSTTLPPVCTSRRNDEEGRAHHDEDEDENGNGDGREKRVKLTVLDATRADGRTGARLRGTGTPANFTAHGTTITNHEHESRPRHGTARTRQPRPGATARGVRDVPLTPILYLARRAAFPVLLLLRRLSSSAATASSAGSCVRAARTIARRDFSAFTSSGARQLALSFNGSAGRRTSAADGDSRLLLSAKMAAALGAERGARAPPWRAAPALPSNRQRPPPTLAARCDVIAATAQPRFENQVETPRDRPETNGGSRLSSGTSISSVASRDTLSTESNF